jgi:hypothetical protein
MTTTEARSVGERHREAKLFPEMLSVIEQNGTWLA